jgi:hypothetical protein
MAKNPRLINLAGHRFGLWVALRKAGNTPNGAAVWACQCDCGTSRDVLGADLRGGKSKSCGCVGAHRIGDVHRSHGQSGTRLHRIWKGMRARCLRKSHPQFSDYGGRGITICPEWGSFPAFSEWAASSGYADDLSIERVDVNGGYSPDNCEWADASRQSANRRFVQVAPDGELWLHKATANGVSKDAYYKRLRTGWRIEDAVSWPMGVRRPTLSL